MDQSICGEENRWMQMSIAISADGNARNRNTRQTQGRAERLSPFAYHVMLLMEMRQLPNT